MHSCTPSHFGAEPAHGTLAVWRLAIGQHLLALHGHCALVRRGQGMWAATLQSERVSHLTPRAMQAEGKGGGAIMAAYY